MPDEHSSTSPTDVQKAQRGQSTPRWKRTACAALPAHRLRGLVNVSKGRRFPLYQYAKTHDQTLHMEGNKSMSYERYTLYPRLDRYHAGELQVSDLHAFYYELSGNPNSLSVVCIHYGLGDATESSHRSFFDGNGMFLVRQDEKELLEDVYRSS